METAPPPVTLGIAVSWIVLFFAGLSKIGWAVGLKYTENFSKPLLMVLAVFVMLASLGLPDLIMKRLPLGATYAVWTGVGVVGTVIVGIVLFGGSVALLRLASIALIVCRLVGLKLDHWTSIEYTPRGIALHSLIAYSATTILAWVTVNRDPV